MICDKAQVAFGILGWGYWAGVLKTHTGTHSDRLAGMSFAAAKAVGRTTEALRGVAE